MQKLSPDQGLAGILEPVFAIRTETDLGIGDTDGVRQMIDWCHRRGLNIFQTLPINETGNDHSPYNSISALAIEPATIALSPQLVPDLTEQKFKRLTRPALLLQLRRGRVKYNKAKALKAALLQAAFDTFMARHFESGTKRAAQFRRFLADHAGWLPDYALFRVFMEENGDSNWESWPHQHQTPTLARAWSLSLPEKARAAFTRRQLFFMYAQWLAYSQWQALKSYGAARRVFLMGDMAFGVARHSADVWANRAQFDLDWSGGAPPEKFFKVNAFTEKWGQNWGVANYRWDEMRRRNFDWWRRRVGNVRKCFHLCRIDHVPGVFRIYSFPWTPDQNAEFISLDEKQAALRTGGRLPGFRPHPDDTHGHKATNQQHGEEILRMVQEAAGDTIIVAEDLGLVPDYVRPTLHKLGMPGFCIPSFSREHGGHYTNPAHYPRLSLVQPTTHDHAPLVAVWADYWKKINANLDAEHQRRELRRMMEFAGVEGEIPRYFTRRLHEGYFRAVLQSNSWLAVIMITDVFGLSVRFNVPGSVGAGNWSQRVPWTVKELDEDRVRLDQTETFSRLAREAHRGI